MGMFDYVNMPEPVLCKKCGKPVGNFQTKDGKAADAEGVNGFCNWIDISEILDGGTVYTFCSNCGIDAWVEFTIQDGKLRPTPPPEAQDA